MKHATIYGSTIHYYARPLPTKHKANRELVKIGERKCKWWLCAVVRKFVYELI